MNIRYTVLVLAAAAGGTMAQNPLVTHMYTADPTARVFNDTLYIYPSSDQVPPEGRKANDFCMPGYRMFRLDGGATWTDVGPVLDQNEVPWGKKDSFAMWAPDCIEKDGKYYYYFPAAPLDGSAFRRIGVGVSDSPEGPFTWEPHYIEGVKGIDPGLFVDDDNRAYLYFGGGHELFVVPLKDNMKEIAAPPKKVEHLPKGYKEASFMFKRNGIYYMTFAHTFPQEGYTIGYATSDSPMGPFVYGGKIMDNIGNGTNHHSITKYRGLWILFYHWWDISGFNKLRSMRADYLQFHKDGSILKVKPTLRGIGTPGLGELIQVDRYNEINGCETAFLEHDGYRGWMVTETKPNSYVRFDRVDFTGAKKIQARIACGQTYGKFEIRQNQIWGKLLAEFPVHYTGGWNSWETIEAEIKEPVDGVHNLVVVFKPDWGGTKLVNLDWLKLTE
ncbi:carbohydrate-binding protein [Verrucomicrobia bacterium S94]|nr:carbohydrate-binding protein [Verrucomicrobia bacterium S94]